VNGKPVIQSSGPDRESSIPPVTSKSALTTNRRRIVGSNKSSSATFISSNLGQWNVFVGRLGKDTCEDEIRDYLNQNDISIVDVKKLSARQPWQEKSLAFRITISLRSKDYHES